MTATIFLHEAVPSREHFQQHPRSRRPQPPSGQDSDEEMQRLNYAVDGQHRDGRRGTRILEKQRTCTLIHWHGSNFQRSLHSQHHIAFRTTWLSAISHRSSTPRRADGSHRCPGSESVQKMSGRILHTFVDRKGRQLAAKMLPRKDYFLQRPSAVSRHLSSLEAGRPQQGRE
jgi:hypothetical protein